MAEPIDFVLASSSPRRRQLCADAEYRFVVQVSNVDEPPVDHFPDPVAYAVHTAWLKANAVAPLQPDQIVVGADTVVAAGNEILGKPADRADAERILRRLMGTRHRVLTGICLVVSRRHVSLVDGVVSMCEMRRLSDRELDSYLDSGLWEGKAGAYGIQDEGDPFIERIEGSFSNIVGLPMERLGELLAIARRLEEDAEKGRGVDA